MLNVLKSIDRSKIKEIWNVLNGKVPVIMYGILGIIGILSTTLIIHYYNLDWVLVLGYIVIGTAIVILSLFMLWIVGVLIWFIYNCIKMELEAWPTTFIKIKNIIKGKT